MGQRFHPAKNMSTEFTLIKHAYSTRLKYSEHAKMSAIMSAENFNFLNVKKQKIETIKLIPGNFSGHQHYDERDRADGRKKRSEQREEPTMS